MGAWLFDLRPLLEAWQQHLQPVVKNGGCCIVQVKEKTLAVSMVRDKRWALATKLRLYAPSHCITLRRNCVAAVPAGSNPKIAMATDYTSNLS